MAEFNKRYPTWKISKEYNHYGRSWKKENIKLIHEDDGFQFSESFLFLPVLQLFLWGIVFLWAQYIDSSNDKWSVVKIKRERRKSLENFILKKRRSYFLYDLVSWAWTNVHSARRSIGFSHLEGGGRNCPLVYFAFKLFGNSSEIYEIWWLFLKFIWDSYSNFFFQNSNRFLQCQHFWRPGVIFLYFVWTMNISLTILVLCQSRFRKHYYWLF